jgi:hypothetical protein
MKTTDGPTEYTTVYIRRRHDGSANLLEDSTSKNGYVGEMFEDMQRRVVIEESDSPWSSPVVLVRKTGSCTSA